MWDDKATMSPRLPDLLLLTQTDERLAALAERGHERAFAVLVERHRPSLARTASRLVGADGAEDVVQQTLLRAWSAIQAGTSVNHVRGWLHQILRNTAFNEHARNEPHDELPAEWGEDPGPSVGLESRLRLAAALGEMKRLPEHQRAALVQTEFGGRSRHQIAADLGVSEAAVRQLVHRARNTLRVAVTAVTPFPLAAWTARSGSGSPLPHRFAPWGYHRVTGAQGAAGGTLLGGGALKAGVTVLAVGALGGGLVVRTAVPEAGPAHRPAQVRLHATLHAASGRASLVVLSPVGGAAPVPSAVRMALSAQGRVPSAGFQPSPKPAGSRIARSSMGASVPAGAGGDPGDPVASQPAASAAASEADLTGGTSSDQSSSAPGADPSSPSPGTDSSSSSPSADSSSSSASAQPSSPGGADAPALPSSTGSAAPGPGAEQTVVAPGTSSTDPNPADQSSSSAGTPGG